jgi:hypothetical protein
MYGSLVDFGQFQDSFSGEERESKVGVRLGWLGDHKFSTHVPPVEVPISIYSLFQMCFTPHLLLLAFE